jgi:hypothetical protein
MQFTEITYPSGIGTPSLNHLAFGVAFIDLDGDGLPDLYVGNGHVFDNVHKFDDTATFEQQDQALHNVGGGRFAEILPVSGSLPATASVTRGLATGDFNNDGAMDILINSLGRPARLLENRSSPSGPWLGLTLIGTKSNRSAIGARFELRVGGKLQVREVRSGGSYISQPDERILFNLAKGTDMGAVSLRIRWPSGTIQDLKPPVWNRYSKIMEPR